MGFPNASLTRTTSGWLSAVPAGAVWSSPESAMIPLAFSESPMEVKFVVGPGDPSGITTRACPTWVPMVVPSTSRTAARPSAFVSAVSGTTSAPGAELRSNTIWAPSTGRSLESLTTKETESARGSPTRPLCPSFSTRIETG